MEREKEESERMCVCKRVSERKRVAKKEKNRKERTAISCNTNFVKGFFKINKSEKRPTKNINKQKKLNFKS